VPSTRVFQRCIAVAILALPSLLQAARPEYQSLIQLSAPSLYYQFNEASGVALNHGSLGSDFDLTYFGAPTRQAATLAGDTGVAFSTVADYLESGSVAPAQFLGNPTMSAEALFYVPIGGLCTTWAPFLHWGPSPLGSETAKSVYFSFSNNDPTAAFAGFYNGGLKSATGSMPLGHWHHFVWVRVGGGNALTGTTVYIDGQDVTGTLVQDALPANTLTPAVTATEFRVNRARDLIRYFTGTLDELVLYDRALTAQEVTDHYHEALDEIFKGNFELATP
jgi:hypothetical protein